MDLSALGAELDAVDPAALAASLEFIEFREAILRHCADALGLPVRAVYVTGSFPRRGKRRVQHFTRAQAARNRAWRRELGLGRPKGRRRRVRRAKR